MKKTTPDNATRRGESSGEFQGLRHREADQDQQAKQRLRQAGPTDRGESAEDQLRDRHSSGQRPREE